MCERNINLPKNQNLITFVNNSAEFTDNSAIFEKPFWPIKKICVNLKFNKLNYVVFEKYLHLLRIHSSFFCIYFYFLKIF
jgi:hypothetical protein